MAGILDSVLGVLNSRAGQSIIPAVGAGLSALGQRSSDRANRELNERQFNQQFDQSERHFNANMRMAMEEAARARARDRQDAAGKVLDANPLGSEESFAAKRAYLRNVLPSVGQFTSSDPRAKVAQGPRMDTPELMNYLSDENTRAAIAARRKNILNLDPTANFGLALGNADAGVNAHRDMRMGERGAEDARVSEVERFILEALEGRNTGVTGPLNGTVPTENGVALDSTNDSMRAQPWHQQFLTQQGYQPGQPVRLNDDQRKALQRIAEANGIQFGRGMEIDPAGNINQDQGVSRYARGAANIGLAAAPLAAGFIPGVGSLAAMGIGAAASAARRRG